MTGVRGTGLRGQLSSPLPTVYLIWIMPAEVQRRGKVFLYPRTPDHRRRHPGGIIFLRSEYVDHNIEQDSTGIDHRRLRQRRAGIQADLKTFQELDVFGMSAITAVTIQNTLGVHGYHELEAKAVADQIDAVVEDLGVDALKTGMIANISIMEVIADRVKHHRLAPLVVDPVMVAKGGPSCWKSPPKPHW